MTPLLWLTLSIVALALGPWAHRISHNRPPVQAALDGFSYAAIAALVFFHILPDAYALAGWRVIVALAIGLLLPTFFERWQKRLASHAHGTAAVVAFCGLCAHAYVDGTALAQGGLELAIGVALHRLPVGLAIWALLLPGRSVFVRIAALSTLGTATVIGFFTSALLINGSTISFGLLEGLVAGSLLHVVFHFHSPDTTLPQRGPLRSVSASGLGAAIGLALVASLHFMHGEGHGHGAHAGALHTFLLLAAQSAPALLLAYLGAGLLHAFMPKATVSWMGTGSHLTRSLKGVVFGLPLPVCSCGVIPLYRTLIVRGTPAAAAMAFLVATPEIGVDAVLLSVPLLGTQFTIVRVLCAAAVAIIAGWLVGYVATRQAVAPTHATAVPTATSEDLTPPARLSSALSSGFGDVVDSTSPWIVLGLAIAAVGSGMIDNQLLQRLPRGVDILVFALAGIPTYVCATGATPLVTMFINKGLSPGAALAFLLTGPATNATTFGVLSTLHGPRVAGVFGLCVTALAVALGFGVNAVIGQPQVFPLSQHHEHVIATWRWAALVALFLVFAASLLRQGPRRYVGRIFSFDPPAQKPHCCHTDSTDNAEKTTSCCH